MSIGKMAAELLPTVIAQTESLKPWVKTQKVYDPDAAMANGVLGDEHYSATETELVLTEAASDNAKIAVELAIQLLQLASETINVIEATEETNHENLKSSIADSKDEDERLSAELFVVPTPTVTRDLNDLLKFVVGGLTTIPTIAKRKLLFEEFIAYILSKYAIVKVSPGDALVSAVVDSFIKGDSNTEQEWRIAYSGFKSWWPTRNRLNRVKAGAQSRKNTATN